MATTTLGAALRHWRDRVSPEAVGLPSGGRRRAAGLRREELSQLAGVSADYITRLEQGRAAHPSPHILEALARALQLTQDERVHLFDLAGLAHRGPGRVPGHIPPSVHRMLDRLTGTPVAVFDAAWTQLLANPLYVALMGEWHGRDLNAVWRGFLNPNSRVRHTPESRRALRQSQVADLRRTAGRYPDDTDLHSFIGELRRRSRYFDDLWTSGAVGTHQAGRKIIDHPHVGTLILDCDVLSVAGSDLRLMVYTAEPGSEDAGRLARLNATDSRALTESGIRALTD